MALTFRTTSGSGYLGTDVDGPGRTAAEPYQHPSDCTGCPRCSPELASTVSDRDKFFKHFVNVAKTLKAKLGLTDDHPGVGFWREHEKFLHLKELIMNTNHEPTPVPPAPDFNQKLCAAYAYPTKSSTLADEFKKAEAERQPFDLNQRLRDQHQRHRDDLHRKFNKKG